MLVQVSEMRVPDTDAWCRSAALRGRGFAVSLVSSSGIATDWGLQSRLVAYIGRQTRSQISIVLRGHGYFVGGSGVVALAPGDVVELDQRRHDDEGYGGSPCEVLVVEWDESGPFGPVHDGPPRLSRLCPSTTARLRRTTERFLTTPPDVWIVELVEQLRAAGRADARPDAIAFETPARAAHLYRAFATVRERLPMSPSIAELADGLGLSERHVRRGLEQLTTEFGMANGSWRDTLSDMRMSTAQQLLSIPGLPMHRVAKLTGYGSPVAFSHALSSRGAGTPGELARVLRDRWA